MGGAVGAVVCVDNDRDILGDKVYIQWHKKCECKAVGGLANYQGGRTEWKRNVCCKICDKGSFDT